jgi:hypothetical protein
MVVGKKSSDPLAYCRRKQVRLAREKIAELRRKVAATESGMMPCCDRRHRFKAIAIVRRPLEMLKTFLHRGR